MLKKLRLRFVCINMVIVLVMLSVILGTVLHSTRQNLIRESEAMMRSVAENPLQLNWPGSSSSRLPYFTVRISLTGEVRVTGTSYYNIEDTELLTALLTEALNSEESTGQIKDYNLRFYRTMQPGAEYVIFADISSEKATMRGLWKNSLMVGGAALGVFLLISILLARWAVKPVDEAWRQQKQFVSDASHELKTPLTVILTNAELLQDPSYGEAERARFADNILTMSHQMRGLVEGLLDLARVDNGAVQTSFARVDLSALTESALLPFEPLFFEKGLELKSDIAKDVFCKGSQSHLRQVTDILLDNAQKYSSSGSVEVRLEKQGHSHCLLSVTSPGEPLSPEECKAVFKRFYRGDKARSMDHSYGLGLAIAESIVAEHRGRIWCQGGDGKNTFFVQLPTESP